MSNSYQVTKKVKNALVYNLRRIFTNNTSFPKYKYIETSGQYDPDLSTIDITGDIPDSHSRFPHIAVDVISGPEKRYIGPDALRETKSGNVVDSDQIFASFDLTANINIYTIDDTLTRDELMDAIHDQFKLITDDLADNAIEIVNTTFNGDTRAYVRDRWYITGRLTLKLYTEWKDDLGVGDTIASIPIDLQINT
jgi:hypothetical protein